MKRYYSNGKLLLTGEYAVLDGATALALPTSFGQALEVEPRTDKRILWKSRDEKGGLWFEEEFEVQGEQIVSLANNLPELSERLSDILTEAHRANPAVFSEGKGYDVSSALSFSRN